MTDRVAGKTALVTGGAGGIGFAIAGLLAREGARVLMADIDAPRGSAAADELRDAGLDARFAPLDVSSEDSWNALGEREGLALARLDVLVNAAGIFAQVRQPLEAIPFVEWRRIMAVNLDSVFLGTRFAVPRMKDSGGGSIVNIGSIDAHAGTTSVDPRRIASAPSTPTPNEPPSTVPG